MLLPVFRGRHMNDVLECPVELALTAVAGLLPDLVYVQIGIRQQAAGLINLNAAQNF